MLDRLRRYWAGQGCVLLEPYDMEVGAGTFHPATFPCGSGPRNPGMRPTRNRRGVPLTGATERTPSGDKHYFQFSGHHEALAAGHSGLVSEKFGSPRHRPDTARRAVRGRRLGITNPGGLGVGVGRCGSTPRRSLSSPTSNKPGGIDLKPVFR